MSDTIRDLLPSSWWAVSKCVDAYESECGQAFPDLRKFIERVEPSYRADAFQELVKVDLERRWHSGERQRLEQYLAAYPEYSSGGESLEELVREEYLVRSRHGDQPTVQELHDRFPQVDSQRVLSSQECAISTIPLGVEPLATRPTDSATGDENRSGTVIFDTKAGTKISEIAVSGAAPTQRSLPAGPQSPAGAPPLTSIGRYTIKQQLGAGSFGLVYRCHDEDLKRDVAVKVPHLRSSSANRLKEFMHEAQSAARLRHPGIVTVLDTSQTADGRVYIVYEFIAGQTLQDRLEKGEYNYADAARWVAETAEALHHAHKGGIVHRDIKPANILLDDDGHTHVADFGLAKMDDQFFRNDAGKVLGTLAYMSPEQAGGQSHWVTPQADIYSLGVMLYQLLCRKLPFSSSGSMEDMLEQIKRRVPPPPRTVDDRIPKRLEEICLQAMAKAPTDRYTTAADVAADLRSAIAEQPPVKRGRGGILLGSAGAAAAAIALFIIWNPWRQPDDHPAGNAAKGGSAAAALNAQESQTGGPTVELDPSAPRLEIHYQRAQESGVWQPLSGKTMTLREGDRVQLHVALGVPRYVYLYWYDVDGRPTRYWPKDPGLQTKETEVSVPSSDENEWFPLDAQQGSEMALVAVSDRPLEQVELTEFESRPAFVQNAVRLDGVFHVASGDVHRGLGTVVEPTVHIRGLGGVVESRKNPLDSGFEQALKGHFASYHGLVMPHR